LPHDCFDLSRPGTEREAVEYVTGRVGGRDRILSGEV
jgi:hypothetical protein